MTLVINAPTTGFVIQKLGLSKEHDMAIRMLKKVMDQHDTKAKEFIKNWQDERSEHGDKGANLIYDHHFDFNQLKKSKNKILEDLRLRSITKLIRAVPAADLVKSEVKRILVDVGRVDQEGE